MAKTTAHDNVLSGPAVTETKVGGTSDIGIDSYNLDPVVTVNVTGTSGTCAEELEVSELVSCCVPVYDGLASANAAIVI